MKRNAAWVAGIALLALLAYWPVGSYPFVALDDPLYVAANPRVREGLTAGGLAWALQSTSYAANWHPLTWLSHMLDVELFGLDAGAHHLVSLALHLGASALLFLFLRAATGLARPSAVVAALFAVHPLHVESAAWVAERKDVLCGFFWAATLLAYLRYVRSPAAGAYALVAGGLALALAAKPMAVTLPLVLLLLDWWPLGRFREPRARVVLEKTPLVALAAAVAAVTLLAQHEGGAMAAAQRYPAGLRAANAAVSAAAYLRKTLWPADLAVYYPHPLGPIPAGRWAGALLLLALATAAALALRRSRPWLAAGWLWFCATIAPVLGLVHAGGQAMADRYAYLPSVGLFVAGAWAVRDAASRGGRRARGLACAAAWAAVAAALATRALQVTPRNWMAHDILGNDAFARGDDAEAGAQFRESLALNPGNAPAHNKLGLILARAGRLAEAEAHYREALQLWPGSPDALVNLGAVLLDAGRAAAAQPYLAAAVRLAPGSANAHHNLALCLERLGRAAEAVPHYRETLRLAPTDDARLGLQRALRAAGQLHPGAGAGAPVRSGTGPGSRGAPSSDPRTAPAVR